MFLKTINNNLSTIQYVVCDINDNNSDRMNFLFSLLNNFCHYYNYNSINTYCTYIIYVYTYVLANVQN